MTMIHRTAIMPYSCEQMFDLVDGIEHYPVFLPWCRSVEIKERGASTVVASIEIFKMGVHKAFTTRNQNSRPGEIKMEFIDGPFHYLQGRWEFNSLGQGCEVSLVIDYELSGGFLNKAFGGVFHSLANSLVDAFCERARAVYG